MAQTASRTFDLDRFVADCSAALREDPPQAAVREVLRRALGDPAAIRDALGKPERGQIQKLYGGRDLTVLNVIWAPGMTVNPHEHRMWAVIGVYEGREDNIFWRRIKDEAGSRVEAAGARSLGGGDCCTLGHDIVHSVTNPLSCLTSAIHVYGGDFFATSRNEWDPETLRERPYDVARAMKLFEDANRRIAAA